MHNNNKLIAMFMGSYNGKEYSIPVSYGMDSFIEKDLKYHCSWNWLMPVVEKIEELGFDTEISRGNQISNYGCQSCDIGKGFCYGDGEESVKESIAHNLTKIKIEAVYEAVVKFINWKEKQENE